MTDLPLAIHFFLQLAVILLACRGVGALAGRLGQAPVVGEMVAGVLLGPSLLGWLAPSVSHALFPRTLDLATAAGPVTVRHPSMQVLFVVSQLGLVLYMFVVGLELDLGLLGKRARAAATVSLAGIVVPFSLGAGLSWAVSGRVALVGEGVSAGQAAFFFGAAMSITAFPMLARILYERRVAGTLAGTLSLAAGAIDDLVAWVLLACVLAVFKGDWAIAARAVGGGLLFALFAVTLGRRLAAWFATRARGDVGPSTVGWVMAYVLACAWFTDEVGIYSVFGAFVAGATIPRGALSLALKEKVESVASTVLLPVFFVFSGLNTQLSLVSTPEAFALAAAVIVAAVVGKGVACALTARASGLGWREAWSVGALMNARGLMELILLNIGLQAGLVTPLAFTVFVLMAIVTTLMATPLFDRFSRGTTLDAAPSKG